MHRHYALHGTLAATSSSSSSNVGENRSKWIINHDFVFYQINDFSLYTETIIKIIFTHETTENLYTTFVSLVRLFLRFFFCSFYFRLLFLFGVGVGVVPQMDICALNWWNSGGSFCTVRYVRRHRRRRDDVKSIANTRWNISENWNIILRSWKQTELEQNYCCTQCTHEFAATIVELLQTLTEIHFSTFVDFNFFPWAF